MDLTVDHRQLCPCFQRFAIFGSKWLAGRRSPRYYESRATDAHYRCQALGFAVRPDTSSYSLPLSAMCPPWAADFARLRLDECPVLTTWLAIEMWSSKVPA